MKNTSTGNTGRPRKVGVGSLGKGQGICVIQRARFSKESNFHLGIKIKAIFFCTLLPQSNTHSQMFRSSLFSMPSNFDESGSMMMLISLENLVHRQHIHILGHILESLTFLPRAKLIL